MRKAIIRVDKEIAGWLTENENGYHFKYDETYITKSNARAVSLTLPIIEEGYHSLRLFPFFDGLIPEGWLLDIVQKNWKLNPRDRMGLLLTCCKDCIGNISVEEVKEESF